MHPVRGDYELTKGVEQEHRSAGWLPGGRRWRAPPEVRPDTGLSLQPWALRGLRPAGGRHPPPRAPEQLGGGETVQPWLWGSSGKGCFLPASAQQTPLRPSLGTRLSTTLSFQQQEEKLLRPPGMVSAFSSFRFPGC